MTRFFAALPLFALALSGCAAIGSRPETAAPIWTSIVSVQAPIAADDATLGDALSLASPKDEPERQALVADVRHKAQERAAADLREAFASHGVSLIALSGESERAVMAAGFDHWEANLPPALAEQLRSQTGADALLRFRITDYGRTPKSWRTGVIAFEVVSTLSIAALAYAYPRTRALAGAYLIQEGIEESAEAYAGFWALDEVCRPVRLQAQLFDLRTGTAVWEGSATGLSDIRLSRLVRTVGTGERDDQMRNATVNAARRLAHAVVDAIPRVAPVEAGSAH